MLQVLLAWHVRRARRLHSMRLGVMMPQAAKPTFLGWRAVEKQIRGGWTALMDRALPARRTYDTDYRSPYGTATSRLVATVELYHAHCSEQVADLAVDFVHGP